MKREILKRILAMALAITMTVSLLPASVSAKAVSAEEEQIRQTLAESVDAVEYPEGLFDFLTARMDTSEDIGEAEFAIVRRGNTDLEATVVFKAIDMTAKYGEDYEIKVEQTFFDKTLAANPEAKLIVEEMYDTEEPIEIASSDGDTSTLEMAAEEATTEETTTEEATTEEATTEEATTEEATTEETTTEEAPVEEVPAEQAAAPEASGLSGLRAARTAFTGQASDTSDWRDADKRTAELLSETYNDMYSELAGTEYTLAFAPGEYMKKIKFVTIDDQVSEDEEQVLFVLHSPENGAISENPTGFMNIKDNEAPEEITFGFSEEAVVVSKDATKAEVTIERKTGLFRYGSVVISSASGTAQSGEHYDAFTTDIAFVPGQQYRKVSIPIKIHPATEAVSFVARLDDEESVTITIEPKLSLDEQSGSGDVALQGVSADPALAASDPWSRKDELQFSHNNMRTCWLEIHNAYNDRIVQTISGVDLSMVGKIKFQYYQADRYTPRKFLWWETGQYRGTVQRFDVNGSSLWDGDNKPADWTNIEKPIPESLRNPNSTLTFTLGTSGYNQKAYGVFQNLDVYYQPIEVQLVADDDAMIQKKTYTSSTKTENSGNAFQAGTLNFSGEGANVRSKLFYKDDRVRVDAAWTATLTKEERAGIYLWGFKIENKSGASPAFYYVSEDSFAISDLYKGKMKDSETGLSIGSTAQLSSNGLPCYRIYPVYKQKPTFTNMVIDESKAQFATGTFANGETVKTGRLDQIQLNIAGKGDYSVSGYSLYDNTLAWPHEREVERQIPLEIEVEFTRSPQYTPTSLWRSSVVNEAVANPGMYLFTPKERYNHLITLYKKPEIKVTVNPRANSSADQETGKVVYNDGQGGQIAAYTGKDAEGLLRGSEITVSPFNTNSVYPMLGLFNEGDIAGELSEKYKFQWQDFTGDIDRNGILSKEEIKALGEGYSYVDKDVYAGNIFNFAPHIMGNPIIYYNIVPKSAKDTEFTNRLSGSVSMDSCSVIENSKPRPRMDRIPLVSANITVGGYSTTTDMYGKWTIDKSEFDVGETYSTVLGYGGRMYTGASKVNRFASDFVVDEYNTFNVTGFKVYAENGNLIENSGISNEDKKHLYAFQIEEMIPATTTAGKVEVKRFGSNGTLKAEYVAQYNNSSDRYEIKVPRLLEENNENPSAYNYSFNPATESVAAGDYMTIRVFDQNDVGYIEHNIGFSYKPKLSVINIVNSFKSPFNDVIEFLGKVDTTFDLGLTQKADTAASNAVAGAVKVETTEETRTISYGWSKDFQKSYDSEAAEKEKKAKSEAEKVKEAAVKTEDLTNKVASEKTPDETKKDDEIKKDAKETADKAVDKNNKAAEKKSKFTAELSVNLNVAVSLVMGYDKEANRYYFKEFAVVGTVSGAASAKQQYTTPIGITLFAKLELSGNITAMMAVEPYYKDPLKPQYLYMDTNGTIDLTKLGNADVDRQLSIYGRLMICPKVTLSVGASFLSDKIASLTLNGSAAFDMMFTTAGNGVGDVTLSANLVLKILGGLINKTWDIANKKYNMFNINGTETMSLLDTGEDYRYDVITPEDTDEKLYLANRSSWNSGGDVALMSTAIEKLRETTLMKGVYPYAQPRIINLTADGSLDAESTQLLTFLDADETGTRLKYAIHKDGAWSATAEVDDVDTDDDTPRVYDMGDKLLLTWSSQEAPEGVVDAMGTLNSRNIKARFFNKRTQEFGPIEYVTKSTAEDLTADDHATAAYYKDKDGNEQLMVSYIKTEYKKTTEGDITVGDLLNAYSTIAYRFYDFKTKKWIDSYSAADKQTLASTMSEEEVTLFEANWYGQGFVNLAGYVFVDDTDILITEDYENREEGKSSGLWLREPTPAEISLKSFDEDPMVVEHESICYGNYGISAYTIDLDRDTGTITDRDVFLQYYDFTQKKFYPMMRLTNDAVDQSALAFAETAFGNTLFYISDGNIVEYDISALTDTLLKTQTANGEDVLVNSRYYDTYQSESVVLEAQEGSPYTEFSVSSDQHCVFLNWGESGIGFKPGIDRNSAEATDPDNYVIERQLYVMMKIFDSEAVVAKDKDGNAMLYPEKDASGNSIDYNVVEDAFGEVGQVKAGDPIQVKQVTPIWTDAVQMTEELGANFTGIDCISNGEGAVRCVYLKGMSEVTEISGEPMPIENTDNRSLVIGDFDLRAESYTVSISYDTDITAGTEAVPISIYVISDCLLIGKKIVVNLYKTLDGEKELIGSTTIERLLGGAYTEVTIPWDTPASLEGIELTAEVVHGDGDGAVSESPPLSLTADGEAEITDVYYEMLDRNTAEYRISVVNNGSEPVEEDFVLMSCGEEIFFSEDFSLLPGETRTVTVLANIPEEEFKPSVDGTTTLETATVFLYTYYNIIEDLVVRSAPTELADLIKDAKLVNAETNVEYSREISMNAGDLMLLKALVDGKDGNTRLDISTSNPAVLSVTNGVLTANGNGEATLVVQISPARATYLAGNTDNMRGVDNYNTLPSSHVKTMTLNARVGEVSSGTSYTVFFDTQGGSKINSTRVDGNGALGRPADPQREGYSFAGWFLDPACTKAYSFGAAVNSSFTLYAKWTNKATDLASWENPFGDMKKDDWFYESVFFVYTNKLLTGVSETDFAPLMTATRGMLVTLLHRMAGEPEAAQPTTYTDVPDGIWYTEAVRWATQAGVAQGYGDIFLPDEEVTREQIALFLYRYAHARKLDITQTDSLEQFADAAQISPWAKEAVSWLVAAGVMNGKSGGLLDGQGKATRAEIAAMARRFLALEPVAE